MSRTFIDSNLLSWEVYSSGGKFGLPDRPKIVFHCLSDPHRPARFTRTDGHTGDAEATVMEASEDELRWMLAASEPL
jgi:hypothetical protein